MSTISIAYTKEGTSTTYNVSFQLFDNDSLPRTYSGASQYNLTAKGALSYGGPAHPDKRIWAISSILNDADAQTLDSLFRAWNEDRADGYNAVVGILDDTFGATVDTDAAITTPPVFNKFGIGYWVTSIGLTEV